MFLLRQIFVCTLLCIVYVSGQVYRPGRCLNVTSVKYDVDKGIGRWYRFEHYPRYHHLLYYQRCSSEKETKNPNGTSTISVTYESTRTCEHKQDFSVALIHRDKENPGIIHSITRKVPLPDYTYKTLEVDYASHMLLYGCAEVGPDKIWGLDDVVIYTRSPTLRNQCLRRKLYQILRDNDINPDFLQSVDHENCPVIQDES